MTENNHLKLKRPGINLRRLFVGNLGVPGRKNPGVPQALLRRCLRRSAPLVPLSALFFMEAPKAAPKSEPAPPSPVLSSIATIVSDFRPRLAISAEVEVSVVSVNPRLVSVQRHRDRPDAFLLSFDAGFLELLDEEELRAVIAHELGHVWIFTNHPFLHTEALANRKAMELVPRESLQRVYTRIWMLTGEKGDIVHFMEDSVVTAGR